MHTIPELGTGVPAFLAKLWKLVEDPETDDLICWSPNGRSFFIRNQAQFARELLPHYYKHNNMASFVRQLNMYGFHKKVSVELGGLKCDRDEMEFAHQFFSKGNPHLVEHIKRKIASSKGQDPASAPIKPELMTKMLTEVRSMRGRQEHLDSRLGAMKRENEALWRELAMLRQKHLKQRQIVNKLIHFLVTLVQPSRGGGLSVKRRYPLMIDDTTRHRSKQTKLAESQASPTGPVIHELDSSEPDLDSEYIVADMLEGQQNPAIESANYNTAPAMEDDTMENIQLVDDVMQLQDDLRMVNPQEIDTRKKRGCKGKKKEEMHLLEMALEDSPVPIERFENNSAAPRPIPVALVRSSKLTAMAATMKRASDSEPEAELDASPDTEEELQENDSTLEKLENILAVPEMIDEQSLENREEGEYRENRALGTGGKADNRLDELNEMTANIGQEIRGPANAHGAEEQAEENKRSNGAAGTSTSKDLSLSCVNSSGIAENPYRLGSMEEMDNHLESMQTELENLRDILRGEGYTIDANTLLGLFGADDPMAFGLPVNPELNPHSHCEKEDDEQANVTESINGTGGGELMAYNPAPSFLDLDDDIFLDAQSPSLMSYTTGDASTNNLYPSDSLDLEDSKAALLETLTANDTNNQS